MAYKRFLIGAGDEFTSAFETDPANVVHQQAYSYSMDNDNEQYSASPFGQPQQGKLYSIHWLLLNIINPIASLAGMEQQSGMEYQQPTY